MKDLFEQPPEAFFVAGGEFANRFEQELWRRNWKVLRSTIWFRHEYG